jgi:hypothetical protein
MAYNAVYSTSDFRSIVVDILGTAGNEIVQWVGMLVLIAVVGMLIVRVGKLGIKF